MTLTVADGRPVDLELVRIDFDTTRRLALHVIGLRSALQDIAALSDVETNKAPSMAKRALEKDSKI